MKVLAGWQVLRYYRKAWLRDDLQAGISVGVLAIPSVIAYAELAGLPPQTGLVTALLGMIAYAFLGSWRCVIVGPPAPIALLIAAGVGPLSGGGPWRAAALASLLALMVGCFLLVSALWRLGAMADFLSRPILAGFMQGAALILIATQLPKLARISVSEDEFIPRLWALWQSRIDWHVPSLALGGALIALMYGLKRWRPQWPVAIPVFLLVILADFGVSWRSLGLSMVGPLSVPELGFHWPALALSDAVKLLPAAVGIVMLAMPEGILMARAFAQQRGETSDANRELTGIGVASVVAGLFGGFPLGASQSRTSLNHSARAKSQFSGLVAAALMGVFLLFFTPCLDRLPSVAVAALLVFAGLQLIGMRDMERLWRLDRAAGVFAILTSLGVLLVGILPGILAGISLSLARMIHYFSRPYDAVLREDAGRTGLHDIGEAQVEQSLPGLIVYRFYAPLLFVNAAYFVDRIKDLLVQHPDARWVVLDAQAMVEVDVTAVEYLLDLHRELHKRNVRLVFARCNRPLREALHRFGVIDALGDDAFFAHLDEAIAEFRFINDHDSAHTGVL